MSTPNPNATTPTEWTGGHTSEGPDHPVLEVTYAHVYPPRDASYQRFDLKANGDVLGSWRVDGGANQVEFNRAMLELTQLAYGYLQRDDQ